MPRNLFTFCNIRFINLIINEFKQRNSRQSYWKTSNVGFYDSRRYLCDNRSTYSRYILMENTNQKRNIDPQKKVQKN